MTGGRPRQPNNPSVLYSLESALNAVARPNPVTLAWRWRYELGLVTGLGFGSFAIVQALGAAWLISTWLVLVAACWAADIRVIPSPDHAHLVIVDVIRRPPGRPPDPESERMTWLA